MIKPCEKSRKYRKNAFKKRHQEKVQSDEQAVNAAQFELKLQKKAILIKNHVFLRDLKILQNQLDEVYLSVNKYRKLCFD